MSVSPNVILFVSICTVAGLGTFVFANAANNSSDSYFAEEAALPGVGMSYLARSHFLCVLFVFVNFHHQLQFV